MEVTIDSSEMGKVAAALAGSTDDLRKAWAKLANDAGHDIVATIQDDYRSGGTTATATAVRTGALYQSYTHAVIEGDTGVELEVGVRKGSADDSVLEYAATQEYGATIRPKKGRYLSIPIDDGTEFGSGRTAAGVGRNSPRAFPDGWFMEFDGRLWFVNNDPRTDELEWLFLMVKQVTVPARPSLAPSVKKHLPKLSAAVSSESARILKKAVRVTT